jgi:hypothetical protein
MNARTTRSISRNQSRDKSRSQLRNQLRSQPLDNGIAGNVLRRKPRNNGIAGNVLRRKPRNNDIAGMIGNHKQPRRALGQKCLSASGMTLVELIVSLLISTIVIGLAGSLLIFGTNFLNRTEIRAEDKKIAEDGADYIRNRLLYARGISVIRADEPPFGGGGGGGGNSGGELLFIGEVGTDGKVHIANSGSLYYMRSGDNKAINVLGDNRYKGSKLALSYQAIIQPNAPMNKPHKSFRIVLKTVRDGQIVYDSSKTFSLFEASAKSEPTEDVAITSWSSEAGFANASDLASYDADARFYLLIDASGTGYVDNGLIAHFDAITNAAVVGTNSQSHHDPFATTLWSDISGNGNDMRLTFTNVNGSNNKPVRDQTIYFDGSDDYGVIDPLNLSYLQAVTVEICFREAQPNKTAILYEYSSNWNTEVTGFGICLNTKDSTLNSGVVHSNMGGTLGVSSDPDLRPVNYLWQDNSATLTTHSNYFSMAADEEPRRVWINGQSVGLIKTGTTNTPISGLTKYSYERNFEEQPFYVAGRAGASVQYTGEIASIRIYDRLLTDAEILQNSHEDRIRFGF